MKLLKKMVLLTLITIAVTIITGMSVFITKNPHIRTIEIEEAKTTIEINEPIEENVTIPTNETCKPDQLFFRGKCFDFVTNMSRDDLNEQFW